MTRHYPSNLPLKKNIRSLFSCNLPDQILTVLGCQHRKWRDSNLVILPSLHLLKWFICRLKSSWSVVRRNLTLFVRPAHVCILFNNIPGYYRYSKYQVAGSFGVYIARHSSALSLHSEPRTGSSITGKNEVLQNSTYIWYKILIDASLQTDPILSLQRSHKFKRRQT